MIGQPNEQDKQSAASQGATSQAPVVLDPAPLRTILDDVKKIIADEKSTNEASEQRKESREKADLLAQERMADWARWMAIIAAIQLPVGVVTLILLWRNLKEARRTADAAVSAAKVAERSLNDLERPFVYVAITNSGIGLTGDGHGSYDAPLRFECVNLGRTPADLLDLEYEIRELAKDEWPEPIIPRNGDRTLPPGIVAALDRPHETKMYTYQLLGHTTKGRLGIETNLFFIGYVRYADVFGAEYVTGFCAIRDWTGELVLRGDGRFNYTRQTKSAPKG